MQFINTDKAREIDKLAQERYSMPALLLMENAGRSVAESALNMLRGKNRIAVVCGKGNNAGDGFVCARHLLAKGKKADIFLLNSPLDIKGDAEINLNILMRLGKKPLQIGEYGLASLDFSEYDLIIDAIFGIGVKGEVSGPIKEVITKINASKIPVLSIDVPSGLNADSGVVLGACIRAERTVTFVAIKRGLMMADGPKYAGKVTVVDLGIPL